VSLLANRSVLPTRARVLKGESHFTVAIRHSRHANAHMAKGPASDDDSFNRAHRHAPKEQLMNLTPGDPAPWFAACSTSNARFHFDTAAGRYIVLFFFGSAGNATCRLAIDEFLAFPFIFDDEHCCFFGVSIDPDDRRLARVQGQLPGFRFFWDFDREVSKTYGVLPANSDGYLPVTVVLDPRLRVLGVFPLGETPQQHVLKVIEFLRAQPPIAAPAPVSIQAPILIVPNVFESEFCRHLIALYDQHGGEESGFMRDVEGKTVGIVDYGHKRRKDYNIAEENVRRAAMVRIHRRLVPEIHKAYQFLATRMERYIVACYDAGTGGYFRPHRDNTTKGTAHRRFAVSLNLNTGEYEGGQIRFPEFGHQWYNAPAGGAVVFSCSLLHEALPVTHGRRYVFLPFLYDDEAAKVREQNAKYLANELAEYRA